jgi:uncharacterized coiled-coil DUF342 family protein
MTDRDNIVLVQLRELRAEMGASHEDIKEVTRRLDRIEKRIDAMHLNGVTALRNFIGHRSMTERSMASIDEELAQLKRRVERLEGAAT